MVNQTSPCFHDGQQALLICCLNGISLVDVTMNSREYRDIYIIYFNIYIYMDVYIYIYRDNVFFFFFKIFIFFDDVLKQFQVLASGVSGVSRYLQHFATDWWKLPILTAVLEPRQPQGVMLLDSKWRTRIGAAMPCCSHGISWLASLITSMEPMEPPRFRRVTWRWIWNILEHFGTWFANETLHICQPLQVFMSVFVGDTISPVFQAVHPGNPGWIRSAVEATRSSSRRPTGWGPEVLGFS